MRDFLVIVLLCSVIFFTPWVGIWALNTLFGLGIAYTFKTWLAALVLGAIISPTVQVKKS
jgi:hypothetical protein